MFFYIGDECNLLEQVESGLFLDKGWTNNNSVWYKGYSTECNLSENLDAIVNGYKPKGIWCVIANHTIYQPALCNFSHDGTTNLYNKAIDIVPIDFVNSINTMDTVVDNVLSILINNCQGYAKHNSDILNIWCTGGLDSVLLLAVCEKANIPYNLYAHKSHTAYHIEYETMLTKHVKNEFPNYQFMSLFSDRTVLGTGYDGDSFFCRHHEQINLLANSLGSSIYDMVKSDHYIYHYLRRQSQMTMYSDVMPETDIKNRLLNQILIWYSVWHLDNTITFTLYRDLDLFKTVLTLPIHELIDASLDGTIQKKVIEKCNPDFLQLVDKQKNTILGGRNLVNNLNRVNLACCKKIFIV
jgi:hypothetical protein